MSSNDIVDNLEMDREKEDEKVNPLDHRRSYEDGTTIIITEDTVGSLKISTDSKTRLRDIASQIITIS